MKIVIIGAYAIGTYLARLLSRNKEEITIIDDDEERLEKIGSDYDLLTYHGSPSSVKALKEAGTTNADLFIAVTPDESENINSCILAHALHAKKTVAQVNNSEYMEPEIQEFYKNIGVDELIYPEILAARDIINGLKMSWVRQRWDVHDGALVMLGIKLREDCEILNQPLKDISGPADPYHVVAIKRGYDTIIPGGNDELKAFDLAYFMTTKQYIPYVRKIVGKEHYVDVKDVMFMGAGDTAVVAQMLEPGLVEEQFLPQARVLAVLQQRPGEGAVAPAHAPYVVHGQAEGRGVLGGNAVFDGDQHRAALAVQRLIQNRRRPVQRRRQVVGLSCRQAEPQTRQQAQHQ